MLTQEQNLYKYTSIHSVSTLLGIYDLFFGVINSSAAVAHPLRRFDVLRVQRRPSAFRCRDAKTKTHNDSFTFIFSIISYAEPFEKCMRRNVWSGTDSVMLFLRT